MTQIFVSARNEGDKLVVADHYEFEAIPRVGEEVVVDQDGEQFCLLVKGVTNFALTKGDVMNQVSQVHLTCDLLHKLDL